MSEPPTDRPTVFCLAGLGLGGASFAPLAAALADTADVVPVDLPGFGRPVTDGTAVTEMADVVVAAIEQHRAHRWLLLGHSMGGKVAAVVAARVLAGRAPVFGLAGVVLLAASPPAPEPMADGQREQMLGWAATGHLGPEAARAFVDSNTGSALPPDLDALASGLVESSDAQAWTDWLVRGSGEDWSDVVGELDLPAVVLAGGADGPLGPDGQRAFVAPHFPRAAVEVLDGAGHFLHLERPVEVADAVGRLWREHAGRAPAVPPDVARVLADRRVAAVTRGALATRGLADDPSYRPRVLTIEQLATLRAVAARVVPQDSPGIDLAARVDAGLATGESDGWRPAELPPDAEAYAQGLDALGGFADATDEEQDELLRALAAGDAGLDGPLSAAQLQTWFEDVRDDLTRRFVMHPATLARLGYDGYAIGGDVPRQTGFVELGLGRAEPWEPRTVVAP